MICTNIKMKGSLQYCIVYSAELFRYEILMIGFDIETYKRHFKLSKKFSHEIYEWERKSYGSLSSSYRFDSFH